MASKKQTILVVDVTKIADTNDLEAIPSNTQVVRVCGDVNDAVKVVDVSAPKNSKLDVTQVILAVIIIFMSSLLMVIPAISNTVAHHTHEITKSTQFES